MRFIDIDINHNYDLSITEMGNIEIIRDSAF